MCCFSRPVESITATKIFARGFPLGAEQERQFIVYSMNIRAREELAMVLPIPVRAGSGENAGRFINLKGYPTFFEALESGFPEPPLASPKSDLTLTNRSTLAVHGVGDFQASFVPTGHVPPDCC